MNSDAVVNGRFIWEHTTEDRAMYLANNGYWKVSTKANARTGDGAAYMLLRGHTDKSSPSSLDTRQWKEAVDKVWTYWSVKKCIRVLGKDEAAAAMDLTVGDGSQHERLQFNGLEGHGEFVPPPPPQMPQMPLAIG
jgi:hypothetical protein